MPKQDRGFVIFDDDEIQPVLWELPDCAEHGNCDSVCCCAETVDDMGEQLDAGTIEILRGDLR